MTVEDGGAGEMASKVVSASKVTKGMRISLSKEAVAELKVEEGDIVLLVKDDREPECLKLRKAK
jgi:hypothetical protein